LELRRIVVATIIVVAALSAVSEIALPLTFAAVLAVIFKPLVGILERDRVRPALAAGLVVLGLLVLLREQKSDGRRGI
jgi:putative heme transporter